MHADISFSRGAQESIADGMRQDIGIGVPVETRSMRNFDPAENQLPPRFEGMNIVPYSDSHVPLLIVILYSLNVD